MSPRRRSDPRRRPDVVVAPGLPREHAILGQELYRVFADLRLSASFLDVDRPQANGEWSWYSIHEVFSVAAYELVHGAEKRREASNVRAVERVRRDGKLSIVQHAGFHDLFMPLSDARGLWGVLIAGPFAIERPTSGDVLSRWRWLTGGHGHASDPEFTRYVSTTLATTTFDSAALALFKRLLVGLGKLFAGRGSSSDTSSEVQTLQRQLRDVRFPERMWDSARAIVDEATFRSWESRHMRPALQELGLKRRPNHAIVGLSIGRVDETDPVGESIRRDAFQRACVELAKKRGGLLCGRVGEYGVTLLCEEEARGERAKRKLAEIAERAAALARGHGLRIHFGISDVSDAETLPARFQAALAAAERALALGRSVLHVERGASRQPRSSLAELRGQLSAAVGERPESLMAGFERYVEAVSAHSGYRFDATRAHLEVGFDLIAGALRANGGLDERSFTELGRAVARAASEAVTVEQLALAYRRAFSDIVLALSDPKAARQDRGLRRTLAFVQNHFGEPLTLKQVARVAGFAPHYFSRLFAESEGTTFQSYLRRLRLERAKRLIATTTFGMEHIGQLCGFTARVYFHRVFKAAFGLTPTEYRSRAELHEKAT